MLFSSTFQKGLKATEWRNQLFVASNFKQVKWRPCWPLRRRQSGKKSICFFLLVKTGVSIHLASLVLFQGFCILTNSSSWLGQIFGSFNILSFSFKYNKKVLNVTISEVLISSSNLGKVPILKNNFLKKSLFRNGD